VLDDECQDGQPLPLPGVAGEIEEPRARGSVYSATMTRVAHFQPFSGASGDMILGALVDAGLRLEELSAGLARLGVKGWKLAEAKELRGPFLTTRVKVITEDGGGPAGPGGQASGHAHDLPHDHGHAHEDGQGAHHHGHSHGHGAGHVHSHHAGADSGERGLAEILRLIAAGGLPAPVAAAARRVFERLGAAEARVHGVSPEQIRFHEVGAVDSIVDIVGVCLGLHLLGVDEVSCAPITVGTGYVSGAHGKMPLPAPATLELLRGFPIEQRDSRAELTTPTGAALLTTLAGSFGTLPPLRVETIGYGAGDDRPGPIPNAIRLIIGERTAAAANDRVVVLETHIDDMSPEWLGYLQEKLFEAGALDVSVAPLVMKKSRPAHALKVIVTHAVEPQALRILFAESTTFGLRRQDVERVILTRELHPVETPWGTVRVKVGRAAGDVMTAAPEYEDLRAAAQRAGRPLKEVHERVLELFRAQPPTPPR
jgi:hypothetical protein